MPVSEFLEHLQKNPPVRVDGTAVFLSSSRQDIPLALLNNLKHNKVLHQNGVTMTIITEPLPRVGPIVAVRSLSWPTRCSAFTCIMESRKNPTSRKP